MANGLASGGGFCAGSANVVLHQVSSAESFGTLTSEADCPVLQRINSPASVFSASLPPLLAVSASEAISLLSVPAGSPSHPLTNLPANVAALRAILDPIRTLEIPSAEASPVIHLYVAQSVLDARGHGATTGPDGASPGRTRARSHSAVSHPAPAPTMSGPAGLAQITQQAALEKMRIEQRREEQEGLLQDIVDLAAENGVLLTTAKRNWEQELVEHRPSIRICVTSGLTKKEVEKAGAVIKSAVQKVLGKGKK